MTRNGDLIVAFKQNVSHGRQDTSSSCLVTSDTVFAVCETAWKYRLSLFFDDTFMSFGASKCNSTLQIKIGARFVKEKLKTFLYTEEGLTIVLKVGGVMIALLAVGAFTNLGTAVQGVITTITGNM